MSLRLATRMRPRGKSRRRSRRRRTRCSVRPQGCWQASCPRSPPPRWPAPPPQLTSASPVWCVNYACRHTGRYMLVFIPLNVHVLTWEEGKSREGRVEPVADCTGHFTLTAGYTLSQNGVTWVCRPAGGCTGHFVPTAGYTLSQNGVTCCADQAAVPVTSPSLPAILFLKMA